MARSRPEAPSFSGQPTTSFGQRRGRRSRDAWSKRALVTGSSIGIGAEIARVLAREGAAVAVHGRDPARTQAVAAEIAGAGGRSVAVLGDVTDDAAAVTLVEQAERQLGGIDILVNNAGGSGEKHRWEDTPLDAWSAAFDRNVLAAVRLSNRVIPKLLRAGWGRIVNVSSLAGAMPPATGPDYLDCKAAINNLTLSLSMAAAGDGVMVNAISPGTIFSEKLETTFRRMVQDKGWTNGDAPWSEIERAMIGGMFQVPVGRVGQTTEVANAVAFLCSPLAGYITGIDLRIDGGVMPAL